MYIKILTIFFSIFLLISCKTTDVVAKSWEKPVKPALEQPQFVWENGKSCLDEENARLLRDNIIELQAYEEKLEFLIDEMIKHYTK